MGRGRFLDDGGAPARERLRTAGRAVVPSSRALVGALLLAVSGIATFAAWHNAAGAGGRPYAVAGRPLEPGARIRPDDVRLVSVDLPVALAEQAFGNAENVVGRTTYGPIGEGELLQAAQLSDVGGSSGQTEVAFALPRDRLLDGNLRAGEWVDVFATDERETKQIASRCRIVALNDGAAGSLAAGGDMVVTLGLPDPADRMPVIHAVRNAEVTLTRSVDTRSEDR